MSKGSLLIAFVIALGIAGLSNVAAHGQDATTVIPPNAKKFGKSPTSSNGFAFASAGIPRPQQIWARVIGTASRPVDGNLHADCRKSEQKPKRTRSRPAHFEGTIPFEFEIGRPWKKASNCSVGVSAAYSENVREPLKVQVFALSLGR